MRPALPIDPAPPADPASAAAAPPRRPACPTCLRPLASCLCRWITPTANALPLLILQHPLEARHAKGSARLLQLSLGRCRCEVGAQFDPAELAAWLAEPTATGPAGSLLLYPDEAAAGCTAIPCTPAWPGGLPARPVASRLVLLDGTWRQSRRLLQANPLLQALPRWALPSPPPSRYVIRQAQRPQQRSSLEAACLALGALEGRPAFYAPLLAAFDAWVASVARLAARRRARPAAPA